MRQQFLYQKMCLLALIIVTTINSNAQQQFTQTVTTQNRNCNSGCSVIDVPALTNNTNAIIMITPVLVNGLNSNPHPIGAYYMYLNQWSVFNLDATAITVGAKFNVEYYLTQDSTHFVYVVPQRVNINDVSYIDRPGLNNHPNAQVRVFPHVSYVSGSLGNTWNKEDVKVQYDATVSKWYIANVNNTPVPSASAYNVVFTNVPGGSNPPNNTGGNCNCAIPTSLPPNGSAGGDLNGAYPNPIVKGLQGNPVSNIPPAFGDVLKWNGSEWVPSGNNGTASSNKPSVLHFEQTAGVDMQNPNINSATIPGLENKTFTIAQSSRVVFHTVVLAGIFSDNLLQLNTTGVWLKVEILNSSNAIVSWSTNSASFASTNYQTITSVGIGVLPAGTYHTRVSITREQGGSKLDVFMTYVSASNLFQGGQMIIEIFPD